MTGGQVMKAVHSVFETSGDSEYARTKTNRFIAKCGCILENGPNQEVDFGLVKSAAKAMLDIDGEKMLFNLLGVQSG